MDINNIFSNDKHSIKDGVFIFDESDDYTSNFGSQWKDFQQVQIDSLKSLNIGVR